MKRDSEIYKVLVVDDEPDLREVLSDILQSQNIQVDVADNGITALDFLYKNPGYHAVICDIKMPEMNGLECLAAATAAGIIVPFVFLTGYADKARMLQAIRLGAFDFISKPFDNNEIIEVLFRIFEIGNRKNRIQAELSSMSPNLMRAIQNEEKLIALMRVTNNLKRS